MKEILAGAMNLKPYNETHKSTDGTENEKAKTVIICGWCGSEEHYVSDGKTECPNCEDFLR